MIALCELGLESGLKSAHSVGGRTQPYRSGILAVYERFWLTSHQSHMERFYVSYDIPHAGTYFFSQLRKSRSLALEGRHVKEGVDEIYVRRPARKVFVVNASHSIYGSLNNSWR